MIIVNICGATYSLEEVLIFSVQWRASSWGSDEALNWPSWNVDLWCPTDLLVLHFYLTRVQSLQCIVHRCKLTHSVGDDRYTWLKWLWLLKVPAQNLLVLLLLPMLTLKKSIDNRLVTVDKLAKAWRVRQQLENNFSKSSIFWVKTFRISLL